jgi:hypothetical protein
MAISFEEFNAMIDGETNKPKQSKGLSYEDFSLKVDYGYDYDIEKHIELESIGRGVASARKDLEFEGEDTMPNLDRDKSSYGLRNDGITQKGSGFLGKIPTHDGKVMTELSIGVNINGKEIDIKQFFSIKMKTKENNVFVKDFDEIDL